MTSILHVLAECTPSSDGGESVANGVHEHLHANKWQRAPLTGARRELPANGCSGAGCHCQPTSLTLEARQLRETPPRRLGPRIDEPRQKSKRSVGSSRPRRCQLPPRAGTEATVDNRRVSVPHACCPSPLAAAGEARDNVNQPMSVYDEAQRARLRFIVAFREALQTSNSRDSRKKERASHAFVFERERTPDGRDDSCEGPGPDNLESNSKGPAKRSSSHCDAWRQILSARPGDESSLTHPSASNSQASRATNANTSTIVHVWARRTLERAVCSFETRSRF